MTIDARLHEQRDHEAGDTISLDFAGTHTIRDVLVFEENGTLGIHAGPAIGFVDLSHMLNGGWRITNRIPRRRDPMEDIIQSMTAELAQMFTSVEVEALRHQVAPRLAARLKNEGWLNIEGES